MTVRGAATLWLAVGLMACSGGDKADVSDKVDTDETDTSPTDDTQVDTDATDATDDTELSVSCTDATTVLRVGSGDVNFEAVTTGQNLEMVHGPQGGWHLNVSVEAENTDQRVVVEITITDTQSGMVVSADDPLRYPIALVPPVLGAWECNGNYRGLQGVLDHTVLGDALDDWASLCGREVQVDVALKSTTDTLLASDSFTVIAQPDPEDGPHCTSD